MIHDSSWTSYERSVTEHRRRCERERPGYFALDKDDRFHQQCLACPLPKESGCMPEIRLPLRVNLVRSEHIGCSDALCSDSVFSIAETASGYWRQAGIRWDVVGVVDRHLTRDLLSDAEQVQVRDFVLNELTRGADGKMQNKDRRREVFLGTVLSRFDYDLALDAYDVWIFDCVGQESQGVCICRSTRTVILGERSSKGYPSLTPRPHHCLAKTMAHELGHALGQGHPAGQRFRCDGRPKCPSGRRNLMQGGVDRRGGGGDHLEDWQICLARFKAERFLEQQVEQGAEER